MHLRGLRLPPGREDKRAPRPGDADSARLFTSLSRNADAVAAAAKGGELGTRSSRDAGSPGLTAALPSPAQRGTSGVRELTKPGEAGAGGGTRGPRRRARSSHPNWKEPVLPGAGAEPPQPRAPRGTGPSAPPRSPQTLKARAGLGGGHGGRCGKGGCPGAGGAGRPGSGAPEHARAPHLQRGKAPGSGRARRAQPRPGGVGGLAGGVPRPRAALAAAAPQDPAARRGRRRGYLP